MTPVLREILETRSVRGADGTVFPVHSQIPGADGEFLQQLILREKPKVSLEVGLAYGISALYLCEALTKCGAQRHIVIDPVQHGQGPDQNLHYDSSAWQKLAWSPETGWRGIGLLNLERAGFSGLIEHLNQPSHAALPSLAARKEKIDFAFIDGWHTFDYVLLDFFYIDMLLRVGGVIAFDDSNYPAIRKVLRYVLTNRRYSVIQEQRVSGGSRSIKGRAISRISEKVPLIRRFLSAESVHPDSAMGLPAGRCIALRKEGDDILGDGTGVSRSWNFHKRF